MVANCIHSALVLRKREGSDSPPPIVLKCSSLQDKIGLLRAARESSSPQQNLQITARLTQWQQEQRKAQLPTLRALKEKGVAARFFSGHVLQKKVGGAWVSVTTIEA